MCDCSRSGHQTDQDATPLQEHTEGCSEYCHTSAHYCWNQWAFTVGNHTAFPTPEGRLSRIHITRSYRHHDEDTSSTMTVNLGDCSCTMCVVCISHLDLGKDAWLPLWHCSRVNSTISTNGTSWYLLIVGCGSILGEVCFSGSPGSLANSRVAFARIPLFCHNALPQCSSAHHAPQCSPLFTICTFAALEGYCLPAARGQAQRCR
jgi:hypothetical protein